jgi:flagellar biosynthetic protein FliQ
MDHAAMHMLAKALETAMLLCLPMVASVALTGIVTGMVQTIVQIQDQNVSFLPKLVVVAFMSAIAGAQGLALLIELFRGIAASAPRLLGH